jgi:hypothetical protein
MLSGGLWRKRKCERRPGPCRAKTPVLARLTRPLKGRSSRVIRTFGDFADSKQRTVIEMSLNTWCSLSSSYG